MMATAGGIEYHKYTGHEPFGSAQDRRDSESGLDHTLYRQYVSNMSRWLSPDPPVRRAPPPTHNPYPGIMTPGRIWPMQ
ncbi:MAG: hypothetical protein HYX73_08865 [Acidobacteria bacterium]|nr:hypothetical protein [Acidobacteriota bacterium]